MLHQQLFLKKISRHDFGSFRVGQEKTNEVFYFNNYKAMFWNDQNRRDDKEEYIVLTFDVFAEFFGAFQFFEDHYREEKGHETVDELLNSNVEDDNIGKNTSS